MIKSLVAQYKGLDGEKGYYSHKDYEIIIHEISWLESLFRGWRFEICRLDRDNISVGNKKYKSLNDFVLDWKLYDNKRVKIIIDKTALPQLFKFIVKDKDHCYSCNKKITLKNFGAVVKEIGICCNNIVCLIRFRETCEKYGISLA